MQRYFSGGCTSHLHPKSNDWEDNVAVDHNYKVNDDCVDV